MARYKNGLGRVGRWWHYCFKVNGRIHKGSTRVADRATAERILQERRREVALEEKGLISGMPTVQELLKLWLDAHRSIHSAKHLTSVEGIIRLWVLPRLGCTRIDRVTTPMILEVRQGVLDAGRSPLTANLLVRSVRLLWNFAIRLGYLERRPFEVVEQKVQQLPRPTVPLDQVQAYLAVIDRSRNPHVGALIRVMLGLGLRESEALGMRWEWFDPLQRTYTVGRSKTKTSRTLPLPSWLWDHLQSLPRTLSPWVFPAEDGQPHRPAFLRKPLARAAGNLGLGRVSAHRLRATFCSWHAAIGTPLTEIQGLAGHRSVLTTRIYVEEALAVKRTAQDTLAKRLGLT